MRRDRLPYLYIKGYALALAAGKALALLLLWNVVLAFAASAPVTAGLHDALDTSVAARDGRGSQDAIVYTQLTRQRPDLLGDAGKWVDLLTGSPVKGFFSQRGAAGSMLLLSLVSILSTAVLAGGFAGRFGAERDRGSLSAFGGDCGRFAFSSILLSVVSVTGIVLSYLVFFRLPGELYEAPELPTEIHATALLLARLALFLTFAGLVRLVVLYARASIGISRNGSPFAALASGAAFVAARPVRTLVLEVAFGASALLPLALWAALVPAWNGESIVAWLLVVPIQQGLVPFRIATRTAHLAAACGFMRAAAEQAYPAAEKIEVVR